MNKLKYTRILLICIMMGILAACSQEEEPMAYNYDFEAGATLDIAIVSDIHYLSDEINDHGQAFDTFRESGDGKQLNNITHIMDAFVGSLKKSTPDILIISGDLTTNGAKKSHLGLIEKLNEIEAQGTYVYVIPGNHDINNPWAREFSDEQQLYAATIDMKDFSDMYGAFGYEEAALRDKSTLSYLVTPSEDLWLLMLDTNKYGKNNQLGYPQADGEISPDTQRWIESCISMAGEMGATVVPVMHHNLLTHSEVVREGYTLNNSEEVKDLFMTHRNNIVLSGHIHIQDICSENRDGKTIYEIVTNALSVYPHQIGQLTYTGSEASFTYKSSMLDVSGWAEEEGIDNEQLLQFDTYSENYFGTFAYDRAFTQLNYDESYTREQVELMSDTIRTLNLRYFSGTEHMNGNDFVDSQGYQLLMESGSSFLKTYALSILNDKDMADNQLTVYRDQ